MKLTPSNYLKQILNLVPIGLFFVSSLFAYSQQTVSGSVTEDLGPLPGVSVVEKGTSNGTVTDFDGNYTITIQDENAILVFSYIGFLTQEVVANLDTINVVLNPESDDLDEVIVTGYGSQRKATITGAVTAIKGGDIVKSPAVDITNSLSGRLPGITVRQSSGEPGFDGSVISIRGINTFGNTSPLTVIDGIPDRDGGIGRLNPQDIESISVLKDASSAIYGARAANGVILVTTKKGSVGPPTLEYSFNAGFSTPSIFPKLSSSHEYATILNELPIYKSIPVNEWDNAWSNIQSTGVYDSPTADISSLSANFNPEAVQGYLIGNDPWKYPNTDWYDDTFKDWAPQQRHNIQLSGGTERLKYFTSLGYVYQDAIYENSATFYKQYSIRTSLEAKVNDYIKMNVGLMSRREDRNSPTVSADDIFRMLQRGRPTEPAIWPTGEPGPDIENGQNPVVVTTGATGYVKNPKDYIQFNGGINLTNPWIENLEFILSGSVDVNKENTKRWETPWQLYSWNGVDRNSSGLSANVRSPFTDARLQENSNSVLNTTFSGQLKYDFTIGENHKFGLFVGATREEFSGSNFFAFRRNFISPAVDQLFAGGTADQNAGGFAYNRTRLGYYGRLQYNYNDTYLVEFLFRRDGSYIFPTEGRYGNFPGVLVGWNIKNESWFDVEDIQYLKLRASYGELGNDQVFYNGQLQEFAFLSTYGFREYPINSQVVKTLYETVLPNPNFTWEVAKNSNIGLDAKIFNRFNITLEWFSNQRENILIPLEGSTPESSGIVELLPPTNSGKLKNQGYEFSIRYDGGDTNYSNPGALRYTIGVNGGYTQNEVVKKDEAAGAPDYQLEAGKPFGAYLLYESDGVFFDQADISANTLDYSGVTSQLIPGDLKLKDINNDGKIDAEDQVRQNYSIIPTLQYGITMDVSYKNFDLSILFQGSSGAKALFEGEFGDIGNFYKYQFDNRWSIDSPSREHPRLASRGDTYYTGGNFGNNTYRYFSTDYFRLKNLELGYNVPETLLTKGFVSGLRIYVSGLNLFTISEFDIWDPEIAGRGYPLSKVLNVGFKVNF
ncbi:TonB-dependent receptor [Flavobacteriaceae bacterium]|nr:TonB-dependent receptor [Flavobacteriaceae bacterium]